MTLDTLVTVLAKSFGVTFQIFILTIIGSIPLGLLVSFGRMSKWAPFRALDKDGSAGGVKRGLAAFKPIQLLVKLYISVMRGTPLMLQLMVVFFGPSLLLDIQVTGNWRFKAAILAFVINYAAYFAEIFRSGIEAVPVGQYEAANVLGYTKAQTFFKIVLPQVVKRILPPVTNEVITLVKDTSLASTIGLMEMFTRSEQIASSQSTLLPFAVAAVFYYVFNYIVAFVMERCEKSLAYYR